MNYVIVPKKTILVGPIISLIIDNSTMHKMSRRQMASTAILNLTSHIDAVSYSNFTPRSNNWPKYKHVSDGAKDSIIVIKKVTGTNFEPINTTFLLNEDYSSQYYYAGVVSQMSKDDSYYQIETKRVDDHNRRYMWTKSKSHNEIVSGIIVNFACGDSVTGYVYPIIILVSGLSDTEILNDDFNVIHVEALTINGHINQRNKELGFVYFMKHGMK